MSSKKKAVGPDEREWHEGDVISDREILCVFIIRREKVVYYGTVDRQRGNLEDVDAHEDILVTLKAKGFEGHSSTMHIIDEEQHLVTLKAKGLTLSSSK